MRFAASVNVMPKAEISDPQGQTIERALPTLGFDSIRAVRVGKRITFDIDAATSAEAEQIVRSACERFLTNPVIEEFQIELTELASAGGKS